MDPALLVPSYLSHMYLCKIIGLVYPVGWMPPFEGGMLFDAAVAKCVSV